MLYVRKAEGFPPIVIGVNFGLPAAVSMTDDTFTRGEVINFNSVVSYRAVIVGVELVEYLLKPSALWLCQA